MANNTNGTRRLDPEHSTAAHHPDTSVDEVLSTYSSSGASHVDDAVVDEILRSISDQTGEPVPIRTPPAQPQQPRREEDTLLRTRAAGNSYSRAAAKAAQQQAAAQPAHPSHAPGNVPDPSYYAMRDPSQSQSFRPATPVQRTTDRIPTIVEEKPVRRKSVLGKLLTLLVTILVLVALVLGVRMLYIVGPSMGLSLPDLTQLPVISLFFDMVPEEETTLPDTTTPEQDSTPAVRPSSVTLDAESVTLEAGGTIVLTATLDIDIEEWDGQIYWASGKTEVATIEAIGPTTAQVTWAGEGRCVVMAYIDGSSSATGEEVTASCSVVCEAGPAPDASGEETGGETETETETPQAEHIDIVLNREDFTLNTGESHLLMDENADQVSWTSSDESVATVNANGVVTAVGAGTCTITATGPDGTAVSAICRVR